MVEKNQTSTKSRGWLLAVPSRLRSSWLWLFELLAEQKFDMSKMATKIVSSHGLQPPQYPARSELRSRKCSHR